MKYDLTITGTRIGVAALAALAALTIPAGPASAAPVSNASSTQAVSVATLTPAECDSLRQTKAGLEAMIETLQERLATAPPPQKGGLIARIKILNGKLDEVDAKLAGCPA
jgi:hypothetical protein